MGSYSHGEYFGDSRIYCYEKKESNRLITRSIQLNYRTKGSSTSCIKIVAANHWKDGGFTTSTPEGTLKSKSESDTSPSILISSNFMVVRLPNGSYK